MGFSILILLIHTYFRFLKRAPAFFFIILFEHSTFLFHMQRKGLVLRHLIMDMLIPPYIRSWGVDLGLFDPHLRSWEDLLGLGT